MKFKELCEKRQSCRHYTDKKVSDEDIRDILESVRLCPSACNSQPWKFVVVKDEVAEKMPEYLVVNKLIPINKWTKEVSTFIVVCETKARLIKGIPVGTQHYAQMDIGIATATICYAAEEKGIGTCIMGAFKEEKIKELLGIPDDIKIRLVISLGYPEDKEIRNKSRKDFDDIVSINKW